MGFVELFLLPAFNSALHLRVFNVSWGEIDEDAADSSGPVHTFHTLAFLTAIASLIRTSGDLQHESWWEQCEHADVWAEA